jgi:putative ABC transport system ATP-binding protein
MIETRGLHHTYGSGTGAVEVLHDIDLRVEPGEFVAVMGPSGCGKTTLLHILGLITRSTRAESIRIDGVETAGLSDAARTRFRARKIGFVFQRFNLLPIISAVENVRLALRLRGQSPNGEAEDVLKQVGLSDALNYKPGQLSIGQQQRVAIARALVTKPRLLLADEPTGNLDSENAAVVMDLLEDCHRRFGQTVVVVTHNPSVAARAERILVMRDGRFREC